jgi:hypothetical protein
LSSLGWLQNHYSNPKTMQIFTLVIILVAVHIVQGTPGLTSLALAAVKATTKSAAKAILAVADAASKMPAQIATKALSVKLKLKAKNAAAKKPARLQKTTRTTASDVSSVNEGKEGQRRSTGTYLINVDSNLTS